MIRIVFIGAVDFSAHCLQEVCLQTANVVAVLNPEPQGSHYNSDYADLAPIAAEYHLPLFRFRKISDPETVTLLKTLQPDVIFVFGLSQLIPPDILALPPLGCIGTHPALLPRNRGRHPLIWALVKGLSESGLTFLYLDEGTDSGDILWQRSFLITLDDTSATLYLKIKGLASVAIKEFLPQLESGVVPRIPQDHTLATYWRKRTYADGEINWRGTSLSAYNLIRALTHPYSGAHTFLQGRLIVIWRSRLLSRPTDSQPARLRGEIVSRTENSFVVACGEGTLEVLEWDGVDLNALKIGDRFESVVA